MWITSCSLFEIALRRNLIIKAKTTWQLSEREKLFNKNIAVGWRMEDLWAEGFQKSLYLCRGNISSWKREMERPARGGSLLMSFRRVFESLWCPVATCSPLCLEFMFRNSSAAQSTGVDKHRFLMSKRVGELIVSGFERNTLIMRSPVRWMTPDICGNTN